MISDSSTSCELIGIFELLCITDRLRDRIAGNPSLSEFRRACLDEGMKTLRTDGFEKVAKGQTTIEEVFRVTESGD